MKYPIPIVGGLAATLLFLAALLYVVPWPWVQEVGEPAAGDGAGTRYVALGYLAPDAGRTSLCGDLLNMYEVGVPAEIIAQVVAESADVWTAEDVECVARSGAPRSIVLVAKGRLLAQSR